MNELDVINQIISQSDSIALLCHVNPDGDTIGSALGLAEALEKEGKRVEVICAEKVPKVYEFLENVSRVLLPEQASGDYDAVILIDSNEPKRCGEAAELIKEGQKLACIDHHILTGERDFPCYICSHYGATAQAILDVLALRNSALDQSIATSLFVALSTDTGHFAYSNTTERTMLNASLLLRYIPDVSVIYNHLYGSYTLAHAKLMNKALLNMKLLENSRIAYTILRHSDFTDADANAQDAEGLVELLRSIETVEACFIIRESAPENFNISMRSKDAVDSSYVMSQFGGGGHRGAAGMNFKGDPEEQALRVVELIKQQLK